MFGNSVAERWRICRKAGNISAILEKGASNADKGQGKERYISNIGIGQKSIPYKFRTFDTQFRNTPPALDGWLKASHAEHKLRVTYHKRILNPRQPTWKAGGHTLAACLAQRAFTG
jgi:hypothetical protein